MKKFVPLSSVNIEFPVNYILGIAISVAALLASIVILNLSISTMWKILLITLLCLYTYYLWQQHVNYTFKKSWISCQKIMHDQWLLQNRSGDYFAAKLRDDTFVSSWLVILRLQLQISGSFYKLPRIASIPLFSTMLPKKLWRQLCFALRWHKP